MELEEMQKRLAVKLKPRRYAHCLGVMDAAEKLALHYGVDRKKAILAGLLHDCARCYEEVELINQAKQRDIELTDMDYHSPVLLHAAVGAILAKEEYGIEDEEILQAIRLHTVAGKGMTNLDKIIYLADMIEVHRVFPGVEKLRAMAEEKNLDEVLLAAFNQSIQFVLVKDDAIHPNTIIARNEIILKRDSHGRKEN